MPKCVNVFAVEANQGAAAIDLQITRSGYEGPIDVKLAVPCVGLEFLSSRIDAGAKEARLYLTVTPEFNADTFQGVRLVAVATDQPDLQCQ